MNSTLNLSEHYHRVNTFVVQGQFRGRNLSCFVWWVIAGFGNFSALRLALPVMKFPFEAITVLKGIAHFSRQLLFQCRVGPARFERRPTIFVGRVAGAPASGKPPIKLSPFRGLLQSQCAPATQRFVVLQWWACAAKRRWPLPTLPSKRHWPPLFSAGIGSKGQTPYHSLNLFHH